MSLTRPLTKRPGNAAHFSSIVDDSNAQTNSQPVLCAREKGPKNVFLSSLPSFCFFTIKNTSKRNQMVCVPDCYGGAVRLNLPALDGNALYFNLKCIIAGWVKCTLELKCFTVCCWWTPRTHMWVRKLHADPPCALTQRRLLQCLYSKTARVPLRQTQGSVTQERQTVLLKFTGGDFKRDGKHQSSAFIYISRLSSRDQQQRENPCKSIYLSQTQRELL